MHYACTVNCRYEIAGDHAERAVVGFYPVDKLFVIDAFELGALVSPGDCVFELLSAGKIDGSSSSARITVRGSEVHGFAVRTRTYLSRRSEARS